VLMNLVTAIIVNGAIEGALQDKEAQRVQEEQTKKTIVKRMKRVFQRLDEDGSGEVTVDEIQQVSSEDKALMCELTQISSIDELFEALDVDGSGSVTIDEFCYGIHQAALSKVPVETQRMERQLKHIVTMLQRIASQVLPEDVNQTPRGAPRSPRSPTNGEAGDSPDPSAAAKSPRQNSKQKPTAPRSPRAGHLPQEHYEPPAWAKPLFQDLARVRDIVLVNHLSAADDRAFIEKTINIPRMGLAASDPKAINTSSTVAVSTGTAGLTGQECRSKCMPLGEPLPASLMSELSAKNKMLCAQLAAANDVVVQLLQEFPRVRPEQGRSEDAVHHDHPSIKERQVEGLQPLAYSPTSRRRPPGKLVALGVSASSDVGELNGNSHSPGDLAQSIET